MVKRKSVYILVVLLTVMTHLGASPFSLHLGTIQEFQKPVGSEELREADIIDGRNWASGGEMRLSAAFLSLDTYMIMKQGEIIDVIEDGKAVFLNDIQQRYFGMAALSVSTKVAAFTTVSIGAGPAYGINLYPGWQPEVWLFHEGNVLNEASRSDPLRDFTLSYRARMDISFSRFSVGVSYSVSSFGPEDPYVPDWAEGKIGFSFITTVF